MSELGKRLCFPLELEACGVELGFVGKGIGPQFLDRAWTVKEQVLGQVDGAHSSFAQDRLDAIATFQYLTDF